MFPETPATPALAMTGGFGLPPLHGAYVAAQEGINRRLPRCLCVQQAPYDALVQVADGGVQRAAL